jgi:chemotaxis protein histidine kinase CheA
MKVKIDFVTNSSSESFGIVAVDTVSTIIATGGLTVMVNAAKDLLIGDATDIAREVAEAVKKEAEFQTEAVMEGYSEAERIIERERVEIQSEIDHYKQQWEESDKTADKTDPGYDKLKKEYEEYIEYLENGLKQKEYEKHVIQVEKAEQQAQAEAKDEWIKQRQVDLIAAKEEKALLQATHKGYGSKGFDVKDIEQRLKQLEAREKELTQTLQANDAMIDYKARDRGVIGPGAEFEKMAKEFDKQKRESETATGLADAKKRAELEAKMAKLEAEQAEAMRSASRWNMATKAAEGVQFGADVAIEGLSWVTGPVGKKIKTAYGALKNVGSGLGEGMADPKNAGKHLAKGFAGAATEVAKSVFGDGKVSSNMKSALANMANEATQGALDASIGGEDGYGVMEGALKGVGKGALDSVTDFGLDQATKAIPNSIKSKIPLPKGSSVDVGDFNVSQIYNNNPLSKGVIKTVVREGLGSKGKDAIKGALVDGVGAPLGITG